MNQKESELNRLTLSQISSSWSINFDDLIVERLDLYKLTTFSPNKKLPIHNWYPYLQGYSANLVSMLIQEYNISNQHIVLDPWCGVGTTNLVCSNHGIQSVGIDISPLSVFISQVKTTAAPSMHTIKKQLHKIQNLFQSEPKEYIKSEFEILEKSFPKKIYLDLMHLKEILNILNIRASTKNFLKLAFLSTLEKVSLFQKDGSHYRFKTSPKSEDVLGSFMQTALAMCDLGLVQENNNEKTTFHLGDSRKLDKVHNSSINFVITSPPYLNRNNYIAQNKLELILGDFVTSFQDYRRLTHSTLRSHVEAKSDKYNHELNIKQLNEYIDTLIIREEELNNSKTLDMVRGYFIDMYFSLKEISRVLKNDGKAFLIVGNSAWAGVSIEVDKILAEIGLLHGLKTKNIFVTRYKLNSAQQIKKYGKIPIRESIIVLEKYEI